MNNFNVNFLDAVGVTKMGHPDLNIAERGEFAAVFSGKANYF